MSMEIKLESIERTFDVTIEGTRPLLMHSTLGMTKPKGSSGRGERLTPQEEAEEGLYLNKAKEIVMPSLNILATMKAAASDFKVGGKGKKTFKAYIDSGVEILPDEPLLINNGWEIDARPVVIQRARIIRSRPKFETWSIKFQIKALDPLLLDVNHGGEILKEILEAAGRHKGLGDFRPRFGQFRITSFEEAPR